VPSTLRVLRLDDHAGVQALMARQGWPQRSPAGWAWALFDNPARQALGAPAGWVLEHQQQIVGFLGNWPLAYFVQGRLVYGATCTSYLVDERHRAKSVLLLRAFAAQRGVAFVYSATANAHSAPVYRLYKFDPLLDPDAQCSLRWVADDTAWLRSALDRWGWGWAAAAAAPCGAPLLAGVRRLSGWSTVPAPQPGVVVRQVAQQLVQQVVQQVVRPGNQRGVQQGAQQGVPPSDLAAHGSTEAGRWQHWWDALARADGLWLDRSQSAVAWRLADPELGEDQALWQLSDAPDGVMLGLCHARAVAHQPHAAPKAELLDWAVLPSTPPAACAALLQAVVQWAAARGLAMVEAKRYTGSAAASLRCLRPQARPLPPDGNWSRVLSSAALAPCATLSPWGMTAADSDSSYALYAAPGVPAAAALVDSTASAASAAQGGAELRHQLVSGVDLGGVKQQHVDLGAGGLLDAGNQVDQPQAVQQPIVEHPRR